MTSEGFCKLWVLRSAYILSFSNYFRINANGRQYWPETDTQVWRINTTSVRGWIFLLVNEENADRDLKRKKRPVHSVCDGFVRGLWAIRRKATLTWRLCRRVSDKTMNNQNCSVTWLTAFSHARVCSHAIGCCNRFVTWAVPPKFSFGLLISECSYEYAPSQLI